MFVGKTLFFVGLCLSIILQLGCKKGNETHQAVQETKKHEFAILIHGGATTRTEFVDEADRLYRDALQQALKLGYEILESGGSATDAVEKAIVFMENSPLFNAGKGSVFDSEGKNKMDASIMNGRTLNCGSVAGLSNIKNPIKAARLVMEKSKHVFFSDKGAKTFSIQHGLEEKEDAYFYSESSYNQYKRAKENEAKAKKIKYGTVGAVALDKKGNLVAATSTGGLTNKKFGRIGDSPIIGAGTYANNNSVGVSCTGTGEYFIRTLAAHQVHSLVDLGQINLQDAVDRVIHDEIAKMGGSGGLIALDKNGNPAWSFNTANMYRGYRLAGQEAVVKIAKDK